MDLIIPVLCNPLLNSPFLPNFYFSRFVIQQISAFDLGGSIVALELYHNNQSLVTDGVRGRTRVAVSSDNACEIGHSSAPFVCD